MTEYFKFYFPQYNPAELTGAVGGAISSKELASSINELFVPIDVSSGGYASEFYQYRKMWIKQVSHTSYSYLSMQTANVEYNSRFAIATGNHSVGTGTATNALTAPSEVGTWTSNLGAQVNLLTGATSEYNSKYCIWIRQKIVSGDTPDTINSLNIRLIGY